MWHWLKARMAVLWQHVLMVKMYLWNSYKVWEVWVKYYKVFWVAERLILQILKGPFKVVSKWTMYQLDHLHAVNLGLGACLVPKIDPKSIKLMWM